MAHCQRLYECSPVAEKHDPAKGSLLPGIADKKWNQHLETLNTIPSSPRSSVLLHPPQLSRFHTSAMRLLITISGLW